MKNDPKLMMTESDFQKISALVMSTQTEISEMLEEELGRAAVVPSDQLPKDVVTMNSTVSFTDLDSGKKSVVTLVYPHEANIEENKVSILAPVGAALIGLRVGQIINWPLPQGKERRIKVESVLSQPETDSEAL